MLPARPAARLPALLLIAASLALSALAIVRDPLLGGAAIDTLVSATRITDDWGAALRQPAKWSLHALLVALVQELSPLSPGASARLVDAALFAILAMGFARLLARLGSEQRFFGWGALVLLLFPSLNALRGTALGDVGCWAFLFAAAAVLARYHARPAWPDAFRWALLSLAAVLFGMEALPFALVLPLACLWREPYDERPGGVLRLYAALGTLCLIPLLVVARIGDLSALVDEVLPPLLDTLPGVARGFSAATARMAEQVLQQSAGPLAAAALAAALLAVLAVGLLKILGIGGTGLLGWAITTRRALLPDSRTRAIALLLLGCAALIAVCRVAAEQSLGPTALMPLALALLIPATFAARELLMAADATRRPMLARGLLSVLLVILLAQGFVHLGARTGYPSDCIAWMGANLPSGARVFSNDRQLAWYSQRLIDWDALADADRAIIGRRAPLDGTDYWVIRFDTRDREMAAALVAYGDVLDPVAQFGDGRTGRVLILARRR